MKASITVLGLGRMGSALAKAFVAAGHRTTVWNRTPAKAEALVALGAKAAPSVAAAVEAAEIVVMNVDEYTTSDRLLAEGAVAKALAGKTLVQLTSGTPKQAQALAAWAEAHQVRYLDGAIMATPDFIGQAGCTILYSGARATFEQHEVALRSLGGNPVHLGAEVGHASALDGALLGSMWGAMFGVLQGIAVCQAEGVAFETFMASLLATKPVIDAAVTDFSTRIHEGRLAGDATTLASVAAHDASLRHLIEMCKDRHLHRAVPEAFASLLGAAMKAGHAQDDFAVLAKFMGGARG